MARRDIIAIGGSLGAVNAVKRLCRDLPGDLAASLLITIHVGANGNDLLADIFAERSSISVSTAAEGDPIRPGHAYVAPADRHLLVIDGMVRLGRGPRENLARPAIDPLFRSVAASFGSRAIAVILTGTMRDGVAGLADCQRCGGITIVQTPGDAFAPELPRQALRHVKVDFQSSLADLAALLVELSRQESGRCPDVPADIFEKLRIALG